MIIAAAIQESDGKIYSLPKPKRHHDIIRFMVELGLKKPIKGEQGFLDSSGRFLNRAEAADLALRLGLVKPETANIRHVFNGFELYSEDLW